jgi:S-DNA-T family DNA segregation ATPase FtsK/SpoIIIE
LDKLAFSIGLSNQAIFQSPADEPKTLSLDIPRAPQTWKRYSGSEFRNWLQGAPAEWELPVYPGVDVLGAPFGFDLAVAPHLLVGGTTGSGKSVCLHALLQSLLLTRPPEQVQVVLIDPKAVEFNAYAKSPHLFRNGNVLTQPDEALEMLNELVVEMEARHQQFARIGVRDLGEAIHKGLPLPRVVVFVEELADLILRSDTVEELLIRLAQKARSAGIHLVLATQRPDANTFSGLLRSNIPARIALTVQKASESKIILDETGAEALTGRGDMLIRLAGQALSRIHGVLLNRDDMAFAVNHAKGAS